MMLDYIAALLRRIWKGLTDGSQVAQMLHSSSVSTSGTLGALNAEVVSATAGYAGATFVWSTGLTGTVSFQASYDNGATYRSIFGETRHTISVAPVGSITNPTTQIMVFALTGTTHIKMKVTSYSIGSCTGTILLSTTPPTGFVTLTAGAATIGSITGTVTYESSSSLSVVSGHKQSYNVHLDVQNATGTVGYMLIDLSDTTNWKHTATGHIIVEKIIINVNPSSAYLGDIEIGFLSSVDATDGDLNKIIVIHGERASVGSTETYDFAGIGLDLKTTNWFGPVTANDTTWQTDVNLYGPSGATSFPAGAGDLVMKLISTAGNVDIGVTIVYNTGA